MDKKYNVLIVEDHALTLFALKTTLQANSWIDNVYEANTAENAFKILESDIVDLIVMDLGLPDINGVEATKKIREKDNKTKIIILTSHSEKEEVTECLKAGINAYCTKDIKPEKLSSVIKDFLSGSMYFDSAVSDIVIEQTKNNESSQTDTSIKDCYNLTTQEKRVLILLASGLSNNSIAKKLNISINTTKVHVCSILQKMKVEDRTQAAIKAIRENLIV